MKRIKIILAVLCTALILSCSYIPTVSVKAFELTAYPTGICVTYYDGINSRGFAWQTATSVTESKLIVARGKGNNADWANAVTINGSYTDFKEYRMHKAQICNLEAGEYSYKVGSTNAMSDVGTFTVDLVEDDKVRFVYVTDSQETSIEGFGQWKKTLDTATGLANPDFIAFAGDLVDNSHAGWGDDLTKIRMEEWSYAFDVPKNVIMNYPFVSASGNHERGGWTYFNHNNVNFAHSSSTGGYYSFVYDNLHFIVLDSNEATSANAFADQLAWLENELANSTSNWKVVMLHIGPYSTGDHSNDSDAIYLRNALPPLFAKYEVDLVLQGHDHVYTRTLPYYYGENENGKIPNRNASVEIDGYTWDIEPDGTYYATINYSGTKSYPPVEYDTSRIFPATSPINGKTMSQEVKNRMFADVQIDGNSLIFNAYLALEDGSYELYDYFAVKKNTYEQTAALIDALPATVTPRDSIQLKTVKDSFDCLTERAVLRLGNARVNKLNQLLSTFDLQSGLNAYEVITVIDLLDIANLNQEFWSNYTLAKNLFYSLTESEKELVVNREKLIGLEDNISQTFLVQKVQAMVNALATSDNFARDKVIAMEAYNLLSEQSKALITGTEIFDAETPSQGGSSSGDNSSNEQISQSAGSSSSNADSLNENDSQTILIVCICVVIAAAAAVGVYFIIKKKGGKHNEE